MKYFSPTYWFKLLILSAPFFNEETTKSIDNKDIKDWTNTSLDSISDQLNFIINNQTNFMNYQQSLKTQTLDNNLNSENSINKYKPHYTSTMKRDNYNLNLEDIIPQIQTFTTKQVQEFTEEQMIVFDEKRQLNNNTIKLINKEQDLPTIANHTDEISKNIKISLEAF
ncbi:hypothetical protein [Spiroplasma endosymbiont of Dactylopius coccus]|nr:hypothetical protein [Spiroplasma ixodetis]